MRASSIFTFFRSRYVCGSFTHLGIGVLLPILLVTAPHLQGQTANPQLLPYATTLVAGGGTTATFTPNQICPSGKMALDKFGDGCLATEVQLNDPRYVTEDSQGNIFISDTKTRSSDESTELAGDYADCW